MPDTNPTNKQMKDTNKELKAQIRELNQEIDRLTQVKEDLFKHRLDMLAITMELAPYSHGEESTKEVLLSLLTEYHRMKVIELDRKLEDIWRDKEDKCADSLERLDW